MRDHRSKAAYQSWGRFPKVFDQSPLRLFSRFENLPVLNRESTFLPRGLGRSYGDSCLNDGAHLLLTRTLDHYMEFDQSTGLLRVEAGVSFEEILAFAVPRGFFLPVTPGTKFVTLGGAIANDVHGKNHHVDGNISHHVSQFEILRSNGERLICSPTSNQDMFYATIGGLGLTGLITWAELRLRPIHNPFINQEVTKTTGLSDFFALSKDPEHKWNYTVSWVDCLAKNQNVGRGLYIRGNHAGAEHSKASIKSPGNKKTVPFDFPSFALSGPTVKAFNLLYYNKQLSRQTSGLTHYDPFFYPLDAIHDWNKIYGKRGFLQWQCVVPFSDGQDAIKEILGAISKNGQGSFLSVLKTFGDKPSLGLMSFPRPGVTLALDFPNTGEKLYRLLDRLDDITRTAKGSVYIAKDARMSPENFRLFYPRIQEFSRFVDPKFSSSFWRRVTS
jgi:FAD/FMN-containing dehydrogenase